MRIPILWLWITLLCSACTFQSSPTRQSSSADAASNRKSNNERWSPPSGGKTSQPHSQTDPAEDSRDGATPASASNQAGKSAAGTPAAQQPPTTPSADASQSPRTPPPVAGEGAGPASKPEAGDRAERTGEPAEHGADAGGSAEAADGDAGIPRPSLIDAALEVLGGAWDGGVEPWSNGGQRDGRLSAEFVKSVLYSVIGTGVCFVQVPTCVQLCFAIATDCSPCAEDAECAEALKSVCGTLGTCAGSDPEFP